MFGKKLQVIGFIFTRHLIGSPSPAHNLPQVCEHLSRSVCPLRMTFLSDLPNLFSYFFIISFSLPFAFPFLRDNFFIHLTPCFYFFICPSLNLCLCFMCLYIVSKFLSLSFSSLSVNLARSSYLSAFPRHFPFF